MKKVKTATGYSVGGVVVDMSKYTGKDTYSDGDIEGEILAAVRRGAGKKLLHSDNRWPVLYHLSEVRTNLLSWLDIGGDKTVLEIGGGCGALTGTLAAQARSVDMVEISPRRAEIAAYRNSNITIHVGNLNDMEFADKFDYITLIGVLEYAGMFTHTASPYVDFIENCRRLLKPDGVLVVAIENRLGMKYFSGAREDHTGKRFDGITDYENFAGVRTFARGELAALLASGGFSGLEWYYPYPDYKLPSEVFSDAVQPGPLDMWGIHNMPFDSDRWELFSEKAALASLCDVGLFREFSNSFLVLAHLSDNFSPNPTQRVHVAGYRRDRYRVATSIVEEGGRRYVKKTALTPAAKAHIKTIAENAAILTARYGKNHVAQARLTADGVSLIMDYIEGRTYTDLLLAALRESGIQGFWEYVEFYFDNIVGGGSQNADIVGFDSPNRAFDYDLNFDNVIVTAEGDFVCIDYEWLVPMASKKLVLYNSLYLLWAYHKAELQHYGITLEKMVEICGISEATINDWRNSRVEVVKIIQDNYIARYKKRRLTIKEG